MYLFSRVGLPEEILTDREANFTSNLLQEFYRLLIKSIKTSAYHHQTDGLGERFNATLKQMLRKYIGQFNRQQSLTIHFVLLPQHSPRDHRVLTLSAALWKEPKRPPGHSPEKSGNRKKNIAESTELFLQDTYRRLEDAKVMGEKSERKVKERIKQDYDRTARVRTVQVGDLVLVLLPSSPNKLLA